MLFVALVLTALNLFGAVMTFVGSGFDREWVSKIAPMVACFAFFTGFFVGDVAGLVAGVLGAALSAGLMFLPGGLRVHLGYAA